MTDKKHKRQAAAFVAKKLKELEAIAAGKGSTLDAAAHDAGIHPSTLWRWRNGMQEPTLFTFEKLAIAVREA